MSRRSASARQGLGSRGSSRVDPSARSRRGPIISALGGLLAGLLAGCTPESPPQAVAWADAALNLPLEPADTAVADLRWRPPTTCAQVYRITVDDDYPANAEKAFGVPAERSVSTLSLDRDPYAKADGAVSPRLAADQLWKGRLLFFGPKTQDRELERELFFSGTQVGLASPDAACFERTWDPIEDALALGWPTLPGRLVAIGERWSGGRVESRCNRSACADPITGNGGPDAHHLSCVTMPWRETLEGIYEVPGQGQAQAQPQRVAAIASYWSDGHPPEHGIWSERQALVSVDDGRLLAAEITIHHNRYKITRNLRIEAVDACPGGVAALGGAPSEPPEGAEGADPGTEADVARALAALGARKPG